MGPAYVGTCITQWYVLGSFKYSSLDSSLLLLNFMLLTELSPDPLYESVCSVTYLQVR